MQEELDMLRKAVDDLKWKNDYEKGVHKEIVELLETKVANYLVTINTHKENETESKQKLDAQESLIEQNQVKIK